MIILFWNDRGSFALNKYLNTPKNCSLSRSEWIFCLGWFRYMPSLIRYFMCTPLEKSLITCFIEYPQSFFRFKIIYSSNFFNRFEDTQINRSKTCTNYTLILRLKTYLLCMCFFFNVDSFETKILKQVYLFCYN